MRHGQLQQQDRLSDAALAGKQRDIAPGKPITHAPLTFGDRLGVIPREVHAFQFGRGFAIAPGMR